MHHSTVRLAAFLVVALASALARAQAPTADAFTVRYSVLAPDGSEVREMGPEDLRHHVNRARCECGQRVGVTVGRAQTGAVDPTTAIRALLGPQCSVAEVAPVGQFRPCVELALRAAQDYLSPGLIAVHPVWLGNGVDTMSATRDPASAVAAGVCHGPTGEVGVWLCAPGDDAAAGCQPDDFFVDGGASDPFDEHPQIAYDFFPPYDRPIDLRAAPAPGAVTLSWRHLGPGASNLAEVPGYRVLCEEVATGTSAGLGFAPPDITGVPDGKHYINAHNLCGDAPFSTVARPGPYPGYDVCGDGVRRDDEECDDESFNGDRALCSDDCRLQVSPDLYALDWDRVCSDHIAADRTSVTITGLDPGKEYRFVLVVYDASGNPTVIPEVLQATPEGTGAGCRVATHAGAAALWMLAGLGFLARRRRR